MQLYGRAGLGLAHVKLPRDTPAVMGRCEVDGVGGAFVSAHLFPHEGNEAERARQLRQICSARGRDAIVVLGDLTVRRDEVQTLCEGQGLRDMVYSGSSWSPTTNRFYENLANCGRRADHSFDRIFSAGDVWVEGHLVCACRTYYCGRSFFLSDHFGLLGFLDVHAAYGTAGGGDSGVARRRRQALGSLRTESELAEPVATRAMARSQAASPATRAADRAVRQTTMQAVASAAAQA